ncbi:Rv0361 family membrane protein [Gordonia aurantiaca]|uniref:Rv0361 family membrane protein n=1 Tax=Gordonia sp. B21 TaxID=3151852 RepID=UPI0032631172
MAKAAGGSPEGKPGGKNAASRGAASNKPARGVSSKANVSNDDVNAALVEDGPSNWSKAWPFFVAFGLVALFVLGIVLSNISRPAEERVSDDAKVQYAINDLYSARNGADYAKFRGATCAADLAKPDFPSEADFVADSKASVEKNGQIEIPEITDLVVNGDRATAKVHWHHEKSSGDEQVADTIVVRENGEWKVCSE